MAKRDLGEVIALLAVVVVVAAGLCVFERSYDHSAEWDLCSSSLLATSLPILAFALVVAFSTVAMFIFSPLFAALDLPTPPPRF